MSWGSFDLAGVISRLTPANARKDVGGLGSISHLREMLGASYDLLKAERVSASANPIRPAAAGNSLGNHLDTLAAEFDGRARLEFLHAILIVLIRRRIKLKSAKEKFFDLWEKESAFLCQNLSLRWLVSACDTICDHPRNDAEATMAIAVSMLINTVKLYETERLALESLSISQSRLDALRAKRADLFDGLTTFRIGRGDMVKNLVTRLGRTRKVNEALVAEVFFAAVERLLGNDTVFARLRRLHTSDATRW